MSSDHKFEAAQAAAASHIRDAGRAVAKMIGALPSGCTGLTAILDQLHRELAANLCIVKRAEFPPF